MDYILYDVDKIKDFVFDSYRPREVKGASESLKALDFNSNPKPDKNGNHQKSLLQQLKEKYDIPDDHIIYSKGGSGLIKTDNGKGEEICKWLENEFKEQVNGASISAIFHRVDEENNQNQNFSQIFSILNYKVRERKNEKLLTEPLKIITFNQDESNRCNSCGKRVAEKKVTIEKDDLSYCQICYDKRHVFDGHSRKKTDAETIEDICNAKDTKNIKPSNDILIIYGDLNEAGKHLANIKEEKDLQKFSECIFETLDQTRENIESKFEHYGFKLLAPIIGGDDILLFIHPASFNLIKEDLFTLEEKLNRRLKEIDLKLENPFQMNFAFLIAKYNFPIYHLFKKSEDFLKITKDEFYHDPSKQTRFGFFKVLENNDRMGEHDVYDKYQFEFLFDTAKRIHENKKIHTSALHNLLSLMSDNYSNNEKELNISYFLAQHHEFQEHFFPFERGFILLNDSEKHKNDRLILTYSVLEDIIAMKDLMDKEVNE